MSRTEKTPLEKIQAEAAEQFLMELYPNYRAMPREALDAFLVRAFDAGSLAQRELDAEVNAGN